jgi:ubiquinol-cytochrome c reductase cytochrome c subunit
MKSLHAWVGLAAITASPFLGLVAAGAASAENGKANFMKFGCWECHGTAGQGTIAGPKLAPDPLPFDTFSNFVRTTSRLMPPYRETVLLDADLADIYAHLQSISKGPDYKSLRLLAQ